MIRATILLAATMLQARSLQAQSCQTERVTVSSTGTQLTGDSGPGVSMSGDARYVLFTSNAPFVVPGDTNGSQDVFLNDRQSGTVRRISVAPGGVQANGHSFGLALSGDGDYALIRSRATNLVPGDTNGTEDLFAIHLPSGLITRVNVSSQGAQSQSAAPLYGSLSRNGHRIAFVSQAADLVPGDTNGMFDVFVRDLDNGTTTRVSVDSNGAQANGDSGTLIGFPVGQDDAPQMSADGRYVVFVSAAGNLVPGDTNTSDFSSDVFVHDTQTGVTERVSLSSGGVELFNSNCGDAVISADGRYVAFVCEDHGLSTLPTGIYLHDRNTAVLSLVAPTNFAYMISSTSTLWMTPDGQALAFTSNTQDLVPGGATVYFQAWVKNLATGSVRLVSADQQGQAPTDSAGQPTGISDDASSVVFLSYSSNLVPNDGNAAGDGFVRECRPESGDPFCMGVAFACPCFIGGAGIGGCENSHNTGGAKLRASGLPSVTNDTFSLIVTDTTATTTMVFFQGTAQVGGQGLPFDAGLRCVGGNVRRLGSRSAFNGTAWVGYVNGDAPVSVVGAVPAGGATRYYQVLYRDPGSICAGPSNLSNGVAVQWTP